MSVVYFFLPSSPNDKKPFCSVEGEWNGVMYAKYSTGVKYLFFLRENWVCIRYKINISRWELMGRCSKDYRNAEFRI